MNTTKMTVGRNARKTLAAAIGAITMVAAAPAMATVIGFENSGLDGLTSGDTIVESGFTLTVLDSPAGPGGLLGAIVDGSDPLHCTITACPVGNTSRHYLGLNDGALSVARDNQQGFRLSGLDFAFVGPVGGLSNLNYGKLVLTGQLLGGGSVQAAFNFPSQNPAGDNVFAHLSQLGDLSGASLSSLTINACLFGNDSNCYFPANNQAQFGLDNLEVAAVPEPETYAMLLGGLGVMAMLSRRRRAVQSDNA